MFITGETHNTVSLAKLSTWTTGPPPFGRAHKQWLTLLTVLTLELGGREINIHQQKWKNSVWMCITISTYYGVIMTLKTNIWFVNTSTVAVFVAAALGGAVIPHKAKVTLANSWGHTRSVNTALCTHRLTLTRNAKKKNKEKEIWGKTFQLQ